MYTFREGIQLVQDDRKQSTTGRGRERERGRGRKRGEKISSHLPSFEIPKTKKCYYFKLQLEMGLRNEKNIMLHVEVSNPMNIQKTEKNNQSCKSLIFIYQTHCYDTKVQFHPFFFLFLHLLPHILKLVNSPSSEATLHEESKNKNYHTLKRVQEKPNMRDKSIRK